MKPYVIVIPARYASGRLPGKPLRRLAGKPMLQHVYECGTASNAEQVVIATDDTRIAEAAASFSAPCCMTSDAHQSGTDRIAEVAQNFDWHADQRIVNLQGDEPLMPPVLLDQCASLLDDERADIATLASPIQSGKDFADPNIVKTVIDDEGFALYFSRASIPCARAESDYDLARASALHHHGIYAYRNSVLQDFVCAGPSALETVERLEQLRALSLGMKIKVGLPNQRPGPGVDTEEDLKMTERLLLARE